MSKIGLTENELTKLRDLGDLLIPASVEMPGFSALVGIDRLLHLAASAAGTAPVRISAAIAAVPPCRDMTEAKSFAETCPEDFALVSNVICGAYYMNPEVLRALNYPLERRNPAGTSDFADEYMTGIVDPVIDNNRGAA